MQKGMARNTARLGCSFSINGLQEGKTRMKSGLNLPAIRSHARTLPEGSNEDGRKK